MALSGKTTLDVFEARTTIQFLPKCHPFTAFRMIRHDAQHIVLGIPRDAYKPSMRRLSDFRQDDEGRVSGTFYGQLYGAFCRMANKICSGWSAIPSTRRYHNGLFFIEKVMLDADESNVKVKPVTSLRGFEEIERQICDEQDWTELRFHLFNQSKNLDYADIIMRTVEWNGERVHRETKKHYDTHLRMQHGAEISAPNHALEGDMKCPFDEVTCALEWQNLINMYTSEKKDVLDLELNSMSVIGGSNWLNPARAFSIFATYKMTPANSAVLQRDPRNYYHPDIAHSVMQADDSDGDDDDSALEPQLAEQYTWTFPVPEAVWLVPPDECRMMYKLLESPVPWIKPVINKRQVLEDLYSSSGKLMPPTKRKLSLFLDQDNKNMEKEIAESEKRSVFTEEEQKAIVAHHQFSAFARARSISRKVSKDEDEMYNLQKLKDTNYSAYVKRVQQARGGGGDDDDDEDGEGDELDEALAKNSGSRKRRKVVLLEKDMAAQDDDEPEDEEHKAELAIQFAPPTMPKFDPSKHVVPRLVDPTAFIIRNSIHDGKSRGDEHGPYVTKLDQIRDELNRSRKAIRNIADKEEREEAEEDLERESFKLMSEIYNGSTHLTKVHRTVNAFVGEHLRELKRIRRIAEEKKAQNVEEWKKELAQQMTELAERESKAHGEEHTAEELKAMIDEEMKKELPAANLSVPTNYIIENLSPASDFIYGMVMDDEYIALDQCSHIDMLKLWFTAMDSCRYSFSLHLNAMQSGNLATGKSHQQRQTTNKMIPGTYEYVAHQTDQADNTGGEGNDLLRCVEEAPPRWFGIEGGDKAGDQTSNREARLKAQLTNLCNVTFEFTRTKDGARIQGKSIRQCIGSWIVALNAGNHRMSKPMLSRFMALPAAVKDRSDRDLFEMAIHNRVTDPVYTAYQKNWQLRHAQYYYAEKAIQASCINEPTMFGAMVLLRAYVLELFDQGVMAKDTRKYENAYTLIRDAHVAYANHMAYNSPLSQIRNKEWIPQDIEYIVPYLWAQQDLIIICIGLISPTWVSPVEEQMHKILTKLIEQKRLTDAYLTSHTAPASSGETETTRKLKRGSRFKKPIQATFNSQSDRPQPQVQSLEVDDAKKDPHYYSYKFVGSRKDAISDMLGGASDAYAIDDYLLFFEDLKTRYIVVTDVKEEDDDAPFTGGPARAPAGNGSGSRAAPAAPVDEKKKSQMGQFDMDDMDLDVDTEQQMAAEALQAEAKHYAKKRKIPVMKEREGEFLFSKEYLKTSPAEKLLKAARAFNHKHARESVVLWPRPGPVESAKVAGKTFEHVALFPTIHVKPDPTRTLYYHNANVMEDRVKEYFACRDSDPHAVVDSKRAAAATSNFAALFETTDAGLMEIDRDLDLVSLNIHAKLNPRLVKLPPDDYSPGTAWDAYPPNTRARLLAVQKEANPNFKGLCYPDDFVRKPTTQMKKVKLSDVMTVAEFKKPLPPMQFGPPKPRAASFSQRKPPMFVLPQSQSQASPAAQPRPFASFGQSSSSAFAFARNPGPLSSVPSPLAKDYGDDPPDAKDYGDDPPDEEDEEGAGGSLEMPGSDDDDEDGERDRADLESDSDADVRRREETIAV